MAINYNQDIAPLRQQYFPMLAGERGFDEAMKYRQEVIMPMQTHTMKMQQHTMAMQQQELSYEKQKMDLQKARRDAQRQNEALEFSPKIESLVNGILDDETLSPLQKSEQLNRNLVDYSSVISYSPILSSKFGAAFKAIDSQKSIETKAEQDRLKEQNKYLDAIKIAASAGDIDLVNELASMDDEVTPLERALQSGAETAKSKLVASTLKAQEEEQDADRKERLTNYKYYYDLVSKISPSEDIQASYDGKGEKPKFSLGLEDKQTLQSVFTILDPIKYPAAKVEAILKPISDEELRRAALGALSSKIAPLLSNGGPKRKLSTAFSD